MTSGILPLTIFLFIHSHTIYAFRLVYKPCNSSVDPFNSC